MKFLVISLALISQYALAWAGGDYGSYYYQTPNLQASTFTASPAGGGGGGECSGTYVLISSGTAQATTSGASSLNLTTDIVPPNGSIVIVGASISNFINASSVTDNKGNTYILAVSSVDSTNNTSSIFYATIPANADYGAPYTITVNPDGGNEAITYNAIIFSGQCATPLDVVAGSRTIANGNDIYVGTTAATNANTQLWVQAWQNSSLNPSTIGTPGDSWLQFFLQANGSNSSIGYGGYKLGAGLNNVVATSPKSTTDNSSSSSGVIATFK